MYTSSSVGRYWKLFLQALLPWLLDLLPWLLALLLGEVVVWEETWEVVLGGVCVSRDCVTTCDNDVMSSSGLVAELLWVSGCGVVVGVTEGIEVLVLVFLLLLIVLVLVILVVLGTPRVTELLVGATICILK